MSLKSVSLEDSDRTFDGIFPFEYGLVVFPRDSGDQGFSHELYFLPVLVLSGDGSCIIRDIHNIYICVLRKKTLFRSPRHFLFIERDGRLVL